MARRTRIAEGIYRDQYGLAAMVKVGSGPRAKQKEQRFPFDTPITTMQDWQEETRPILRKMLRQAPADPVAPAHTFRADVPAYLDHVKATCALETWRSRVCEINAWLPALGASPRHAITRLMILDERDRWLRDKLAAPKTCNHRLRALKHLYRYFDGSRAETPVDDIKKLDEPAPNPRFVDVSTLRHVATHLTDPATRGRFMVLASTGQRPSQLKRAQPADVDLHRGVWLVRAGKKGHPIPVVLTEDMVVAWQVFIEAQAWGDFDGSDYAKRLYKAGWPRDIRPYNCKHTVAIALANAGTDWEDVKDWFGHRDMKTTRIYTGQVVTRLKTASGRLAGRIGW